MKGLDKRFFSGQIPAYVSINGEEYDVLVEADYQPEEGDVNVGEGVDVSSVWLNGDDVWNELSERQLADIESQILDDFREYCADYFYCKADHELRRRKEQ